MAGAAAGVPAVVRVVEEIKNAVGTCGFSSPPEVDLRLGITADGRYVVVIREAVQCALLNLKTQANKALEGKASQDLAQKLGIGSLATERWPGATHAQATCEVRHIGQVLTWALSRHGGTRWLPDCRKMKKQAMAKRTADKDRQWPSDRTAEKTLEILLSQAHTHHVVVLSSCHIALL